MDPFPTIMQDIDALDAIFGPLETALAQSAEEIAQDLAHAAYTELAYDRTEILPVMMCQFCHMDFLRSDYFFNIHYPRCKQESRPDHGDVRTCPNCKEGVYYEKFWEHVDTNGRCRKYWQCLTVVEKRAANPDYLTPEERNLSYSALQLDNWSRVCGGPQQPVETERLSTPSRTEFLPDSDPPTKPEARQGRIKEESQGPTSSPKTPTVSFKAPRYCRDCGIKIISLDAFYRSHQQRCKEEAMEHKKKSLYDAQTGRRVKVNVSFVAYAISSTFFLIRYFRCQARLLLLILANPGTMAHLTIRLEAVRTTNRSPLAKSS